MENEKEQKSDLKMKNGCCSNCQAKGKKKKKSTKLKEESDEEEDVKQKQKVSENEKPKTDSKEEKKEPPATSSDQKDKKEKKEKDIITWQHTSTRKQKKSHHGNKLSSERNGVNLSGVNPPFYAPRPIYSARSMMYRGEPNTSNLWSMSPVPRGRYPAFSMPPSPMYGPYGGGGGCGAPFPPYPPMARAPMFDGVHISPYPPMAAAFHPPYWNPWQIRPFTETNPMTKYSSYADNYSYCFI